MSKFKIILYSILVGIIGAILCSVALYLLVQEAQKVQWSRLPNPTEEIVEILSLAHESEPNTVAVLLQTKNGQMYICEIGKPACMLSELTSDQVSLLAQELCTQCVHKNPNDKNFPSKPTSRSGRIIDACELYCIGDREMLKYMVLYEDNSIWFGIPGGGNIDMTYFLVPLGFCVGGLAGLILGLIFFHVRTLFQPRLALH